MYSWTVIVQASSDKKVFINSLIKTISLSQHSHGTGHGSTFILLIKAPCPLLLHMKFTWQTLHGKSPMRSAANFNSWYQG